MVEAYRGNVELGMKLILDITWPLDLNIRTILAILTLEIFRQNNILPFCFSRKAKQGVSRRLFTSAHPMYFGYAWWLYNHPDYQSSRYHTSPAASK
jgi:hypothetical protein